MVLHLPTRLRPGAARRLEGIMNIFDGNAPLRRGTVVSCYFPLAEAPDIPGPSARPALIVSVMFDGIQRVWRAVVAYGTSRDTKANVGYEVRVSGKPRLKKAGLHYPTRFTLSRMRILPITREFFAYSRNGSPILGYLESDLLNRMAQACETIAAMDGRLKILLDGKENSVPAWQAIRPVPPPSEATPSRGGSHVDIGNIDQFMRSALTGRARIKVDDANRPSRRNHLARDRDVAGNGLEDTARTKSSEGRMPAPAVRIEANAKKKTLSLKL